ncbi:hypothetical protein BHE74_00048085 [Ensete ventricosum]|nr:hypothetical protein BHE74_00048085 [Ensete ventricosum]
MVADGEGQRLAAAANRLRQRETKVARLGAAVADLGWVEEEEAAVARMVGVRAAVVGLQRLQWKMAGMVGGDKKVGRNYGGRRRKKQPRERKEAVASVEEKGKVRGGAAVVVEMQGKEEMVGG